MEFQYLSSDLNYDLKYIRAWKPRKKGREHGTIYLAIERRKCSAAMGHRGIVYLVMFSFSVRHPSVQQLFYFPEVLVVINQKFSS